MIGVIIAFTSAITSFCAHHAAEKFVTKNGRRDIRLVFRGYHIHHSFFGVAAVACALIFASSVYVFVLFGYGIGNIWQHKYTHNKANEPGMVFISKISNMVQ